jgi:tRNA (pseudouridine54-N1)-methyltransferase
MNLIFFLKSATINLDNYTIKDIPGSSGRLDVISRCILAAILNKNNFERKVKIWVFLDNYGTYIFDPESLDYTNFPKNELMLTDYFANFLLKLNSKEKLNQNPLNSIKISKLSIIEAITKFQQINCSIFVLKEEGKDFFKLKTSIQENDNVIFIIGSQEGKFIDSKELNALNLPNLSLGTQSYLASSAIRLIKLYLKVL